MIISPPEPSPELLPDSVPFSISDCALTRHIVEARNNAAFHHAVTILYQYTFWVVGEITRRGYN